MMIRSLLRTMDLASQVLPRAWTGAPVIAGEPLDPFLHWLLLLRKQRRKELLGELSPQAARQATRNDLLPLRAKFPVARVQDMEIAGAAGPLPARWYQAPKSQAGSGLLLYFHGGGFVIGDLDTHDDICRLVCRESGMQVLSVDYRLAPEHPFPAAVNDAIAATRWVRAHAADFAVAAHQIAVGGDSAGANLAAVAARALAQSGEPLCAQLLFYPGTDYTSQSPSRHLFEKGLFLSDDERCWFYGHYQRDPSDAIDPRISPLLAESIQGIAPAVIVTAALDMLRDEGEAYAERLCAQGALIDHVRAAGLGHGFVNLVGVHHRSRSIAIAAASKLRAQIHS